MTRRLPPGVLRRVAVARRRRRSERGFTLIEVMIAVGIITVGSLGILAMQSATIRGNADARMLSIATQRNRTWLTRLERDALFWNRAGMEDSNRVNTRFLRMVVPGYRPPIDAALRETMSGGEERFISATADFAGRDTAADAGAVFCTHVNLDWAIAGEVLRARVRTVYHRRTGERFQLSQECSNNAGAVTADLVSQTPSFSAVTTTGMLRWTLAGGT